MDIPKLLPVWQVYAKLFWWWNIKNYYPISILIHHLKYRFWNSKLKSFHQNLDVSKKNLYNGSSLPLTNFIKSIQYHSVHFDKLLESNNVLIRNILNNVIKLFEDKKINLFNIQSFLLKKYNEIFLEFSRSKHIGKFILTNDNYKPDNLLFPTSFLYPNKFYLITGGLGGIGIKLIDWMITQGARKFIVTSRKKNLINWYV